MVIAGSGAALGLFAELLELGRAGDTQLPEVALPGSIGTGGAIHALHDGAIEIGLTSRPLRPGEAGDDVVEIAYVEAPLAFVAHLAEPPAEMTSAALGRLLAEGEAWPSGEPIVVIHREPGDSGAAVLARQAPALATAFDATRDLGIVAYTDTEAAALLLDVPGAVALLDPVSVRNHPNLHVIALVGAESVSLSRPLAMVVREPVEPAVARVLEFLQSDAVAAHLVALGYRVSRP